MPAPTNRLAEYLLRNGVDAGRIHGNRSQAQGTQALSGFKARAEAEGNAFMFAAVFSGRALESAASCESPMAEPGRRLHSQRSATTGSTRVARRAGK